VTCAIARAPSVRAEFVRDGFETIEKLAEPLIPPKYVIVMVTTGPEDRRYIQMADPAADAVCDACLTVAYPARWSYS
jgi:hypothetical protein